MRRGGLILDLKMSCTTKSEERNEKIIRGLVKLPPNRRCINCNSLGPQYVCTTFWTFVCITCSGIHREFTHRVKSVSMSKFTSLEVEALQKGGNQRARETFLNAWNQQMQRFPDSSNSDKIREFIKTVYVDKKYAGGKTSEKPPRGTQDLKNHEDESRRASSYHSYSQSPPYEYQYEERRYGKQAFAITRKAGSDRGLKTSSYGKQHSAGSLNERSSVVVTEKNEGWVTFDVPQLLEPSQNNHISTSATATTGTVPQGLSLTSGDNLLLSSTTPQWSSFLDSSSIELRSSIPDKWHESMLNFEAPSNAGTDQAGALFPATDVKSSNPFDIPFDTDLEPNNEFLDMSSLQAILPNGHMPASFIAAVPDPWFSQNPVQYPTGPQGDLGLYGGPAPSTQIMEAWRNGTLNPERRFFGCSRYKDPNPNCKFFQWVEPSYTDSAREVIEELKMRLDVKTREVQRVNEEFSCAEKKVVLLNEELMISNEKNKEYELLIVKMEKTIYRWKKLFVVFVLVMLVSFVWIVQ